DRDESSRSEVGWSEPARSSKSKDRDESTRSEAAWSEPARSSISKDREEQIRSSASDVAGGSKGNVAWSPTTSNVSKGVTWGQNQTKHFEVESPSEHRDEFVSSSDMKARESSAESEPSAPSKSGGWGAIAAGIMGAGAGAAAASSSDSPKSKTKEIEKAQEKPYEYRGVTVEPESPPRRRSPPSTGPKPAIVQQSRVPGAFEDDLDFTATVAAGLQDTGFDPNIVINDPAFRRRDSPPGSNEHGMYRTPYAETVSDLGAITNNVSGVSGYSQDFTKSEVGSAPQEFRSVSPDRDDFSPKLSKKDQKKREKAAKRQSGDAATFEETPTPKVEETEAYFEPKLSKKEQKKRDKEAKRQSSLAEDITPIVEPTASRDIVEEPESYFEPAKKSKKSKRDSVNFDDIEESASPDASRNRRKVSVPVDAFDDLRNEEDEWAQPKSKKKSKRDSDRYDSFARSVPSEVGSELERSASKKSKDKSKRKSVDQYEPDPAEVSLPPSTPSETSRDGDYDDRKSRKSSSRDSGIFDSAQRGESGSVVSRSTSRYEDEPRKSKKKSRSSTKDDFDDTRSVASAPAGDDFEDSKKSKKDKKSGGSFFGLFGSKSESGARDDSPKGSKDDFEDVRKKKKSKRSSMPDASSLYGDLGSASVADLSQSVSNGHGSSRYDDDVDGGARSDGERKKTRSRADSVSSKKDSFLGKAGTLGAGVGLAGAAVAIAAQHHQHSKADKAYDEPEYRRSSRSGKESRTEDVFDYEIKEREFRPSIDPQYGDLLPLPPSDPASPNSEPLDDLPDLPDSGPETPEAERLVKERSRSALRRSIQDAPMKSPSQSSIPIKFMMGNRSSPSSPGLVRSSPSQSPATGSHDSAAAFTRARHRPTSSWDSAREYKPLYLVESNRRSSQIQLEEEEATLPELPPSSRTSRSSSRLDPDDQAKGLGLDFEDSSFEPHEPARQLSIDTQLASSDPSAGLLDSQQSTPKAGVQFHDADSQPRSPDENASKAIAAAGLVSTLGYFASSPSHRTTKDDWLDELPSVQRQPSPIDPMTKNRSSYLLQSSPMSRKDDLESEDRASDSPLRQKSPLDSDASRSIERSIEEPANRDIFEAEEALQRGLPDQESALSLLPRDAERDQNEAEPIDEFSLTKSKKDKKKDKKKGKGLSRSSTQDDVSLPEPSMEPTPQPSTSVIVEPEEEFSMPKSKKDKKKDKKKGKSVSPWEPEEDEALPEEAPEIVEASVPADAEPFEEFSSVKSKKNKKKGKSISWEPEEEATAVPETEQPLPETSREIMEDLPTDTVVEPSDEFTVTSKKGKKTDKKGKAFTSWEEPEAEIILSQAEELISEPTQDQPDEVPTPAERDDIFEESFTSKSKGDKKKDKKKGKSTTLWEPEKEEPEISASQDSSLPITSRELIDEPTTIADDFETPTTKKSKKDKRKSISWQPEEDVPPAEAASQETQPELEPEVIRDEPAADDFASFSTKKGKKNKKSKSITAWDPEEETQVPESSAREIKAEEEFAPVSTPLEDEEAQEFTMPGSKKSKKKGKKSQALALDDSFATEPVAEKVNEIVEKSDVAEQIGEQDFGDKLPEEPEQFVMSGSKKGKKKNKKSQAWEEDPQPSQPQNELPVAEQSIDTESFAPTPVEEALEEFTMSSSKKGKKKSRKSQAFDVEGEPRSERIDQEEKTPGLETAPDVSGSKDTPIDGPDAWPTTPATPWATAQESQASQRSEYFPSATSLQSPEKRQGDDAQSKGYFPPATALLPVAVAGAAAFAAHESGNDSSNKNDSSSEHPISKSVESEDPQIGSANIERPAPDGLDAGYDNAHLSLARQLQEEFGSGSKKSKKDKQKDKKKRQSLPSTPDPEISRSRTVDEPTDLPPRARSLSIGTPVEGDQRKPLYSEEQLELARQLKADFEKSSKKSKKDKKKRGDSSGPSARDDAFDQVAEGPTSWADEVEEATPVPNVEEEVSKPDGFAAGYQEQQLSLARQLQAEFGSGSKRSKKDKKRRSTSQTPQEQDSRSDDYFGTSGQSPAFDSPYVEEPANIAEAGPGAETTRDGLAVGYNEEQLELARQLKEEFNSKKSKKDKKDKKRQGLGLTNTDDDFSSNLPIEGAETPIERDLPALENTEAGPSEPLNAEPEDEFAFVSKKSKKDKKGKKRESLVRSMTDENPPDMQETKKIDTPQPDVVQEAEPEILPPADDIEFSTKRSKKDKKSKKRDSLLRSTTDDNVFSDSPVPAKESETRDVEVAQPEDTPREPELPDPVDEFEFTTKKSKKDKKGKKRENLVQSTIDESPVPETSTPSTEAARDVDNFQPTLIQESAREPENVEPADEFAFTTKKSKKDKKGKNKESFTPTVADDEVSPGQFGNEVEALHNARDLGSEDMLAAESEPVPAPEDEWAVPGKKSKKDKKKRQSPAFQDEIVDQPSPEASPITVPEESSTVVSSATEAVSEPSDDYGFSSKKSKKDKKKRGSLLRSSTFDDTPEPQVEEQDSQLASGSQDVYVDRGMEPVTANEPDEGFGFTSSKNSKKDKKKRQSMQEPEMVEEPTRDLQKSISTEPLEEEVVANQNQQDPILTSDSLAPTIAAEPVRDEPATNEEILGAPDLEAAPEDPENVFEEYSFSKKSKKDKKKRKDSSKISSEEASGFSTPLDPLTETANEPIGSSLTKETVRETPSVVVEYQKPATKVDAEGTGVWDAFSLKKPKKDKKKKKHSFMNTSGEPSELSTPVDNVVEPAEEVSQPDLPSENVLDKKITEVPRDLQLDIENPAAAQDVVGQPEQDEWSSFSSSKKSKKDKKKRKSGMSTPIETFPENTGLTENSAIDSQPSTSERQVDDVPVTADEPIVPSSVPDIVEAPENDEWGSFTSKKSKKDKNKRQSGISTPFEEPAPEQSSSLTKQVTQQVTEQADEPQLTPDQPTTSTSAHDTVKAPEDDEWGSLTTKKSKKDKKKRQSGISTPIEDIPTSSGPIEKPALEQPASLMEQGSEPQVASEQPEVSTSVQGTVNEPEQEEWSSFSTKQSKKDRKKRKSGFSTPLEEEQGTRTIEQASVIAPLAAIAAKEIFDQPSKVEDSPAPVSTQEPIAEPADDEWGSFSTKKSKKDKKKQKSGFSTPIEDISKEAGPSHVLNDTENQIPEPEINEEPKLDDLPIPTSAGAIDEESSKLEDISAPATSQEANEPLDEWSALSTKSKKHKKNRKFGLSTPAEEISEPSPSTAPREIFEEPAQNEESLAFKPSQAVSEEPVEEWGSYSSKKSKKDKKRKPGFSTPAEEVPEAAFSTTTREVIKEPTKVEESPAPATPQEAVEEPADEWGSFSTKKSKKDKKRKSGLSTPAEGLSEVVENEPASSSAAHEVFEEPVKIEEPLATATPQEVTEDPVAEWGSYSTKKSKKDKKKRKSGLSTPAEEIQEPNVAPEEPRDIQTESTPAQPLDDFESPSIETSEQEIKGKGKEIADFTEPAEATYAKNIVEEPIEGPLPASIQDIAEEPQDEWNSFSTKKSKKGKKNRKSGLSTPIEQTVDEAGFQAGDEFIQPASENLDGKHREAEDDDFGLVAKKSKKDKKGKRGSRVESESDTANVHQKDSPMPVESSYEPGPITSELLIANPVEEAHMSPSFTDKFRDAPIMPSPSSSEHHMGEGADTLPGDLSRASSIHDKRKRQATVDAGIPDYAGSPKAPLTSWANEVEEAEVVRKLPVIEDIAKDESLSHIAPTTEDLPADDFVRPSKKGKKGKKRNSGSIGSQSAMESARSPIGVDSSKGQSEEHSSTPALAATGAALAGAALLSKSSEKQTEAPPSPSGSSTPARKLSKKEKRKMSIDRRAPRDDPFDDPALWEGADPKEFEESKGQDNDDDDGFWSPPQEEETPVNPIPSHEPIGTSREPTAFHGEQAAQSPPKPPARSTWDVEQPVPTPLGLTDIPSLNYQDISPPSESISQSHGDRGVSFEEPPIERTPSRKSRYSTGFSDLPVVREESPVRHESSRHHGTSYAADDANRDSAFVGESPVPPQGAFADDHEHVRDSGVHLRDISPAQDGRAPVSSSDDAIARLSWPKVDEETETVDIHKSLRPKVVGETHRPEEKSSRSSHDSRKPKEDRDIDFFRAQRPADERSEKHHHDEPSSRDLLPSQRAKEEKPTDLHRTRTIHKSAEERPRHHDEESTSRDSRAADREEDKHTDLHRTKTIHGHGSQHQNENSLVKQRVQRLESSDNLRSAKPKEEGSVKHRVQRIESPAPDYQRSSKPKEEKYAELNQSQRPKAERPQGISDTTIAAGTAALAGAGLGFAAARQLSAERRPDSAQSQKSASNINRLRTPDPKFRSDSANSHRSSGTPPLRRSDRKISGDLRSLSQRSQLDLAKESKEKEAAELAALSSSTVNNSNPTANEGRARAKDMADVFDGFGEGRMGSPRSPTRPHSMRRRQSMQVLDLESKVEQLAAENRMLAEAKAQAERSLQASGNGSSSVVEKDAEIDSLKRTLDWLQNEVTRLTEVNDGLASANATIGHQHGERYGALEAQHAQATRELQETRDAHSNLSTGMEGIVRNEVQRSVQEKDQEIAQLRAQLESAKDQIRAMQKQILASKAGDSDFLTIRDEDYFDNACQQLCQHVQQWVLRFSKFSDMRACRLTSEINNDKTIDRLDNAILDGSDVDSYLADRIKRRDVFMSMTMTMVWEFIFTRYLFGMDREQRQKLKSLEKLLSEVGPASAVHHWRATTLTLLSKREAFIQQREQDTEAVIHAVLETLSEILPPPSHLEAQIEDQLKRVMKAAVDLSIEMRTQRAEYMMLPPLQPEYDANGDLASKVSFNSALMNERSGDTVSNEELEAQKAVVRVVLFPLVVKKGDDSGEGDEEIVVCPAQVLVAKPKKSVRVLGPDDMAANNSRMSLQSSMPGEGGSVF
ncbi:hypothetical protein LSUE1_G009891, partial [Lachnellula suecica]